MARQKRALTGKQKAAILLISLGPDVSAQVYKHLTEEEIEKLSLEISSVKKVDADLKEDVIEQFHQIVVAQDYISQGGIGYAKTVLEKAFGKQEAASIINRLTSSLQVRPFDFARKADPQQLLNFIQDEHPQTIALVLSYLDPEQSGQILSALPQEMQAEVARRIATMDTTSPEIISEVEQILEQNLSSALTEDYTQTGGIEAVVEVLNGVDRGTEKTIFDALEIQDPELADEIKKRMFVFEDIVTLDNRAIQRVIREVENDDLLLSFKVASEEVKEIVFPTCPSVWQKHLGRKWSTWGRYGYLTWKRRRRELSRTIRRLEETGEIVIARGGGDDIIV